MGGPPTVQETVKAVGWFQKNAPRIYGWYVYFKSAFRTSSGGAD